MAKKKVTISDIAKSLSISSTTVSFVLNNRQDKGISEETKERVLEKAETLGYRKLVKPTLQGWTRVALLSRNIQFFNFYTSFFAEVYSHLQRKAPQHKLELFLMEFRLEKGNEYAYNRLQEIRNLGIQVFITSDSMIAEYLIKQRIKVVFIQGGKVLPDCVTIYCDDYNAGKVAGEYALQMGHREAGLIFPNVNSPRFDGFWETFTSNGGQCPEQFIWNIKLDHDEIILKITELSVTGVLPSLFYCFADNVLFPVIKAFKNNNLSVPDDVSLIGTDNLYWGRYATPAFTTVDLSEELFADKVIEAVKHVINDGAPYELAVPVKLIARETVKEAIPRD
jgi:LacI family transcriptional regulator